MAEEIKESYEIPDGALGVTGDTGGNEYIEAARIVNSNDIICTGVSVYIESETGNVVGDLTFRLETEVGGEPSGNLAHANATYAMAPGAVTIPGWNRATFTEFVLPAGTYWLVISVPAQANNNFYAWSADNAAGVDTRAYNINGGAWIVGPDVFLWRLYGLVEIIDALFFGTEF